MDAPDFLDQLEQLITNAGSDKLWKRTVGDLELWFSPMTLPAQEKVNETLTRAELGPNVVIESKRVTLSNGIVGLNGIDLRPYRAGQAVFSSVNKEGKSVKVPLEKYLYEKMSTWGGQYVDDVFMVYADLIETHQKENLKDVRFENSKDPKSELLELEARVYELRKQLNLPALVEEGSPAAVKTEDQDRAAPEVQGEVDPASPDFDPFKPVRNDGFPKHVAEAEAAKGRAQRSVQRPIVVSEAPPVRDPEVTGAVASEEELFQTPPVSREPKIPIPPVRPEEVLEKPAERIQVGPPVVDRPPATSVNPRFARPSR